MHDEQRSALSSLCPPASLGAAFTGWVIIPLRCSLFDPHQMSVGCLFGRPGFRQYMEIMQWFHRLQNSV